MLKELFELRKKRLGKILSNDDKMKKISRGARIRKMSKEAQDKMLNNIDLRKKTKKTKKTFSMDPESIELLKDLSQEFSIPQSEILESLLDLASGEYYEEELKKKYEDMYTI